MSVSSLWHHKDLSVCIHAGQSGACSVACCFETWLLQVSSGRCASECHSTSVTSKLKNKCFQPAKVSHSIPLLHFLYLRPVATLIKTKYEHRLVNFLGIDLKYENLSDKAENKERKPVSHNASLPRMYKSLSASQLHLFLYYPVLPERERFPLWVRLPHIVLSGQGHTQMASKKAGHICIITLFINHKQITWQKRWTKHKATWCSEHNF